MAALAQSGGEQRAVVRAGRALLELYPRGLKLFLLAPTVLALAVLPEFLQHVIEIRIGMFDSRAAVFELQDDPRRMSFGYVKVAGLFLATFAAARFWWAHGHGERWWDLRSVAWKRFAAGVMLFLVIPSLPALFAVQLGQLLAQAAALALSLALLPAMFLMLAGLFGDRRTSHRAMWRRSWPWGFLTLLLLLLAFVPPQWLHQMNHLWAIGAPATSVWALMIFDSFLVGLLAGLCGTAFYLGYAAFVAGEESARAAPVASE